MAITELKLRRGTTTDHQSFTGAEGEITIDTSKDTLVVHDGTTVGGHPLSKASEAKGWTTREHYIANGTWTKTGKAGLKRIIVYVWGGGGSGANAANDVTPYGGGQGGHGYIVLDVDNVTDNVAITIGDGGARKSGDVAGSTGGTTSFGSYISATGGPGGPYGGNNVTVPAGGTVSGLTLTTSGGKITAGAVDMGSFGPPAGSSDLDVNYEHFAVGGGPGGGSGVSGGGDNNDTNPCDGFGYQGAGGGSSQSNHSGKGAQGSVLIEEIYGEV